MTDSRKLGGGMIAAMWILLLALLTWSFSGWLDERENPNSRVVSRADAGIAEVVLQRNRHGHYVATGTIDGTPVVFMLDTGATDVSVPLGLARTLGLRQGAPIPYETANGTVIGYATRIGEVALGDIVLRDVRASINPGMEGEVALLGMSFLRHLEFTQRGDSLTLRHERPRGQNGP